MGRVVDPRPTDASDMRVSTSNEEISDIETGAKVEIGVGEEETTLEGAAVGGDGPAAGVVEGGGGDEKIGLVSLTGVCCFEAPAADVIGVVGCCLIIRVGGDGCGGACC